MSGRKNTTITVNRSDYNRLSSRASRSDNAKKRLKSKLKSEQQKLARLRDQESRERQRMQNEYRQGLNALSDDIQQSEVRQTKRINNLRSELRYDLAAHKREVANAFKQHRQEVENRITSIEDDIVADKDRKRNFASRWVSDVKALIGSIRNGTRHDKFTPGELDAIAGQAQVAENGIAQGNYEASIAGSQRCFFNLQDLSQNIALQEAEWDFYLEEARKYDAALQAEIDVLNNAKYKMETETEEAIEVDAKIDYWSDGRYSELQDIAAEISKTLEAPDNLTTEEIRASTERLNQLDNEIKQVAAQAKDTLIQSQMRYQIALDFQAAIQPTGWNAVEGIFERDDFRNTYYAKFTNRMGEELVASIIPEEARDGGVSNRLEVHFFERNPDEALRAERLRGIHKRLKEQGNNLSSFRCSEGTEAQEGDRRVLDFERIKAPDTQSTQ